MRPLGRYIEIPGFAANLELPAAVIDAKGRFVEANPALCDLTGYNRRELLVRDAQSIFHSEDRWTGFVDPKSLSVKAQHSSSEVRLITKTGETVWVRCHPAPLYGPSGDSAGWIALFENLTELKEAQHVTRDLSAQMLDIRDEERRRIARELHDSLGQKLAGLVMILSTLKGSYPSNEDVLKSLQDGLALTKMAAREVRTISCLLHPPLLEKLELPQAMRHYVNSFSERSGIRVDLRVAKRLPRLAMDVQTTLYRVLQEGLNNLHQHSGTSRAVVRLCPIGAWLGLEIRDFGQGMQSARTRGRNRFNVGVGIAGMCERLAELHGELQIHSTKKGTMLRALVPIRKEES
jgi:PAS domain S-box-containing protein